MTQLHGKYVQDNSVSDSALTSAAKSAIRAGKLFAYRTAVASFTASSSSNTVTTQISGAAVTFVPQTSLSAKGVYTGSVSGATDPKKVLIRLTGTDNGVPDGLSDEIFGILSESSGVYTLSYKKSDGSTFSFGSPTSIDFYFIEIFDLDTAPVDANLRSGATAGVIDAGTAASLAAHLDGGANKHDATEIDYERADANKKNIAAGSDDVESAITNLDDAIGGAGNSAGIAGVSPSNYTPSASTVVGHLAGIDTALGSATSNSVAKKLVKTATTAALPANTYNNGTAGLGATLTGNSNGAIPAQDGVSLALNDRLLVKDEGTASHNGIYYVSQVGDGSNPYILTRATDADIVAKLLPGSIVEIGSAAATLGSRLFFLSSVVATVGTDSQNWISSKADPTFLASQFRVKDATDTTKQVAVDASGIATGNTRTVTMPNRNVDLGNVTSEVVDSFTLSGGDITAKQVTLSATPKTNTKVSLIVKGAPPQVYGSDYTVSGTTLSWASLGLDGLLAASDVIIARYLING